MPKGVTEARRFILTRAEVNLLTNGGRLFNRPRVTTNNLSNFRLAQEDLRDVPVEDLIVLEVANG